MAPVSHTGPSPREGAASVFCRGGRRLRRRGRRWGRLRAGRRGDGADRQRCRRGSAGTYASDGACAACGAFGAGCAACTAARCDACRGGRSTTAVCVPRARNVWAPTGRGVCGAATASSLGGHGVRRGRDGCNASVGGGVWCVAGMQPGDAGDAAECEAENGVQVDGFCLRCAESRFASGGVCAACVRPAHVRQCYGVHRVQGRVLPAGRGVRREPRRVRGLAQAMASGGFIH